MTTETRKADETDIRRLIANASRALHDKDVDALVAPQLPDLLTYNLAPPLRRRGIDRQSITEWFQTWDGPLEYEVRDLEITLGDDIAFATSLDRLAGTKVDGQKTEVWLRATRGFRKVGGRWLLVHEHTSVPFYMDGSLRASVDLKP